MRELPRSLLLGPAVAVLAAMVGCGGQKAGAPPGPGGGSGSASDGGSAGTSAAPDAPCDTPAGTATFLLHATAVGLAVDDDFVYVATLQDIEQVPRGGGAPVSLATIDEPEALADDGTSFWTFGSFPAGPPNPQGKVSSTQGLFSTPVGGGTPQLVVADPSALVGSGTTMLANADAVYWVSTSGVSQLARGSSAPTVLGSVGVGTLVESMALGSDAIYLAAYAIVGAGPGVGSIRRVALAGGAVTTIVDGLSHPTTVALDDSAVYFDDGTGRVLRSGFDGSGLTTLVENAFVRSLAVDAHAVYLALDTTVEKLDKQSGARAVVATGVETPGNLVLRGGNVYWLNDVSHALSEPDPPTGAMTACR